MFGGPLREIENVQYMHIYMLLILHPLPTPSFPRLPSPRYKLLDFRQGVLCTIGDLGLSGSWVYRGFCYRGVFFIGEKVIGDLGYRANVVNPRRHPRAATGGAPSNIFYCDARADANSPCCGCDPADVTAYVFEGFEVTVGHEPLSPIDPLSTKATFPETQNFPCACSPDAPCLLIVNFYAEALRFRFDDDE